MSQSANYEGMNLSRRAYYALTRRKTRSLLLFFVLSSVLTLLVIHAGISSTIHHAQQVISSNIGATFAAFPQSDDSELDLSTAEKIGNISHVKDQAYEKYGIAEPIGAQVITRASSVITEETLNKQATFVGTTSSALHPHFTSLILSLTAGKHLHNEDSGALIHCTFAEKNQLKIGDTVRLTYEGVMREIPIKGIFCGQLKEAGTLPAEYVENLIFTDLHSAQALSHTQNLTSARYLVNNADSLSEAVKKAQEIAPESTIADNSTEFVSILDTLTSIQSIIHMLLTGTVLAAISLLTLILIFWARGRIREIGILLAIGTTKIRIIMQYVYEVSILYALASALSLICGLTLTSTLSTWILDALGDTSLPHSGSHPFSLIYLLSAYGLGICVLFIALIISLVPLFRRSPRSILNTLS
ncbi:MULTISPECIES: ABC transporter permease [unclassified Schaalia]|uniref:ABC transporter permease n=1 Tax=unclassified Schaalia TaxID=2691889 RepID=UPI001E445410|nr:MULTISPECIES: FtsX-like permease family protein [unclassified Schaalia]MCD4549266.1 FtsX-like permease family protein [Schaalia sp. lx-260]MCD4557075.1 FtsX-like permease family protein [Schaalia sp. lx-100]